MKLSEIRQILDQRGLRLTRSLGQNFLHDGNQLSRIVTAAALEAGDRILEIGPGLGVVTERLLEQGTQVMAIEKDRRLVAYLQERFGACERLRLIHADALEFLRAEPGHWSEWKLVSNLPYSVASPILVELGLNPRGPRQMVVTVQQEVGERLVARPGTASYGVLSVFLQLHYEVRSAFRIPCRCFFPVPQVESVCVVLCRRPQTLGGAAQREALVHLVKRGFSQRRKKMLKLLRADWPEAGLVEAFAALGLTTQVRAEQVGVEQFVALARRLLQACPRPDL